MAAKVSLKHYLFTGRGENGSLPIYLRITYDRKKAEIHSGYSCTLKEWSEANQATKSLTTINKELARQKLKIYDFLADLQKNNLPVTATALKDLFTGKHKAQFSLIAYFDKYIEELQIRNEIKPISLNKYKQSRNTLSAFIQSKYGFPDLLIEQVNYDFINSYDLHLKQHSDLHRNTINKYHSRLRTLLLRALAEGIINKQPYSNFKLKSVKSERDFLQQDEINKIIKLDLANNKSLDKVRDLFLFSCYTGLRFQDAQNLSTENLINFKGKPCLRHIQEKTGRAVDIPILPIASKILEKYKSAPEREIFKLLLPKISNQKVNSYLKVISDLSGIERKLTHHMARHSFATTICLNNNMPMEDVSKLLGHSSMKTTQIYGRITQQRLINSMDKVGESLN